MSPKIINTTVLLTVAALSLVVFANSMVKPIGRDEQMYCTAGVLLAQGKMIYRDFSYPSQMPYHPLLYAALFRILNTTHYLLAGRILSSVCDVLAAVCIVGIYRRIFKSFPVSAMLLGLASAALYIFNAFVTYANGFAWNNDVVILCVVLSYRLFVTIDFKQKSRYWRIALIGALLSFATFMRITIALVQVVFFAVLVVRPAESVKERFKTALPFLIATAVVSIWPVWTIVPAPRAFFLNLFRVSALNSEWVHQTGMFYNKLGIVFNCLTTPGYFMLIIIWVYLCVILLRHRSKLKISNATNLLLSALLAFVFFIIALVMPATWKQHLAMPVAFIIISFAYPLLYLRKVNRGAGPGRHFKIVRTLVVACAVVLAAPHAAALGGTAKLLTPRNWVPIRLHRISEDIAEKTKSTRLILTLGPLYALEGGCSIYLELSAGPFVYRIADYLSASERKVLHAVGPETLEQLLEKSPPAAVIVDVEPKFLEVPLFRAAGPNRKEWDAKIYDNGPTVYFRR